MNHNLTAIIGAVDFQSKVDKLFSTLATETELFARLKKRVGDAIEDVSIKYKGRESLIKIKFCKQNPLFTKEVNQKVHSLTIVHKT